MKRILAVISLTAFSAFWSCADTPTDNTFPSSDSHAGLSSSTDNEFPFSSAQGPVDLSSSAQASSSSIALPAGTYEKLTTSNAKPGWGSRYWDGCKPHCAWRENVDTNAVPFTVCRNCNVNNEEIPAFTLSPTVSQYWKGYQGVKSSCEGGSSYTCFDMAPVAVNDTLAYAFVATSKNNASCGQCFQLQFDGGGHYGTKAAHRLIKGKTLIVMATNTGKDVEAGQFDIMIPGGGVGIYDSFTKQIGASKTEMGDQYGGLLTACQHEINNYDAPADKFKQCVAQKCNAIFGKDAKFADLLRGCNWFVDWLQTADNPTYLFKPVECPNYFREKYPSTINQSKDTDITADGY